MIRYYIKLYYTILSYIILLSREGYRERKSEKLFGSHFAQLKTNTIMFLYMFLHPRSGGVLVGALSAWLPHGFRIASAQLPHSFRLRAGHVQIPGGVISVFVGKTQFSQKRGFRMASAQHFSNGIFFFRVASAWLLLWFPHSPLPICFSRQYRDS